MASVYEESESNYEEWKSDGHFKLMSPRETTTSALS